MTISAKTQTLMRNLESGLIKNNTDKILKLIFQYNDVGINTDELRNHKFAHQTLTSALSNLLDVGLIKIVAIQKVRKNVYSVYKYVCDLDERKELVKQRNSDKLNRWFNKGLSEHKEFLSENLQNLLLAEYNQFKTTQNEN